MKVKAAVEHWIITQNEEEEEKRELQEGPLEELSELNH